MQSKFLYGRETGMHFPNIITRNERKTLRRNWRMTVVVPGIVGLSINKVAL